MSKRIITEKYKQAFHEHLILEEKSAATMEKYPRDGPHFSFFCGGAEHLNDVDII